MTEAWARWEGQVIDGRFPLRKCLGATEHGAVFLTEYREPALRKAAIKLVPAVEAEAVLARWAAAAKLSHPNLLPLFECGRARLGNMDLLFLVMEYADENLAQVLPQRPLTPQETTEMLAGLLDALCHLHQNGFSHGAIKPANILAADDQLKLSSDSIAAEPREPGGDAPSRSPGIYDPPAGAGRSPSCAADMWSLGMTLIETMTQALPHPESALQAARALPDPFRDMASRCLERDPKKRCSASDLRSWLKTGRAPEAPEGHVHDGSELVAPKKRVEIARPAEARTASNRTAAQPSAKPVSRYTLPAVAACLLIAAIVIVPKFFPAGNPRSPAPTQRPSEMTAAAATPPARSAPVADQGAAALPPAADPSSAAPVPEPPASNSPGAVANRVLPDISASARASLRGTVRVSVRVDVDKGGNVENAEFDARGPSQYFARKAMDAARQWKFSVPLQRGEPVASSWLLRFSFTSGGTQASAEQTAPPLP